MPSTNAKPPLPIDARRAAASISAKRDWAAGRPSATPGAGLRPTPARPAKLPVGVPPFAQRVLYPPPPRPSPQLSDDDVARLFGGVTEIAGTAVEMRLSPLPPIEPRPAEPTSAAAAAPPERVCPVCQCEFESSAGLAKHVARGRHPLTPELVELTRRLTKTCPLDLQASRSF